MHPTLSVGSLTSRLFSFFLFLSTLFRSFFFPFFIHIFIYSYIYIIFIRVFYFYPSFSRPPVDTCTSRNSQLQLYRWSHCSDVCVQCSPCTYSPLTSWMLVSMSEREREWMREIVGGYEWDSRCVLESTSFLGYFEGAIGLSSLQQYNGRNPLFHRRLRFWTASSRCGVRLFLDSFVCI